MNNRISRLAALAAVVVLAGMGAARAQPAPPEWQALVDKAKGQTLVVMHAVEQSIDPLLAEFSRKFGIKVEATVARPSQAYARIATEQKNGQFVWDLWWGGSSNMSLNAAPGGNLEKMEPLLILPEVKDVSKWRHPDFIYGESGHHVFTYNNLINFGMLRNGTVVPALKIETLDALLDPRLKGKISMREASTPNFGTFMLATILKQKGPEFLKHLLKDQAPKIYDNQQLLLTDITRGGQAISIGLNSPLYERCRADGGCKDVEALPVSAVSISWGISVPRNPPHPEAAKAWVNWFLSREGQSASVRELAKFRQAAVSMRKDVEPPPEHAQFLPDFAHPERYVFVSSEKGAAEVAAAIRVYKEVAAR